MDQDRVLTPDMQSRLTREFSRTGNYLFGFAHRGRGKEPARLQKRQKLEARGGIEPPIKVLQTFALPLGDRAFDANPFYQTVPRHDPLCYAGRCRDPRPEGNSTWRAELALTIAASIRFGIAGRGSLLKSSLQRIFNWELWNLRRKFQMIQIENSWFNLLPLASGKRTRNVDPRPGELSTSILPA